MVIKELWHQPSRYGQVNLKSLVGATGLATGVGVLLLALATALEGQASHLGTYGPIVGAAATLVIAVLHQLGVSS